MADHAAPWPPETATGLGPFPGTDPIEATRIVVNELPQLPYLPALPARGVGADPVGRTAALLVDLHVDVQPSGWRFVPRPGRDDRRARAILAADLDALDEVAEGYDGFIKIQLLGPCTMAARVELTRGELSIADPGAVRDLAASLAEGLSRHVAELGRRLPRLRGVVVQLDEPLLGAVTEGRIPTASGWGRLRELEEPVAEELIRRVLAGGGPRAGVVCHDAEAPVGMIRRAGAAFVGLEPGALDTTDDEQLGEALDGGMALLVAIVPLVDDRRQPVAVLEPVRRLWHRVGLPLERLPVAVAVTAVDGLARVSPQEAAAVLRRSVEVGRFLGKVAAQGSW